MDMSEVTSKVAAGIGSAALGIGSLLGGDDGQTLKDLADYSKLEQREQVEQRDGELSLGEYTISVPSINGK